MATLDYITTTGITFLPSEFVIKNMDELDIYFNHTVESTIDNITLDEIPEDEAYDPETGELYELVYAADLQLFVDFGGIQRKVTRTYYFRVNNPTLKSFEIQMRFMKNFRSCNPSSDNYIDKTIVVRGEIDLNGNINQLDGLPLFDTLNRGLTSDFVNTYPFVRIPNFGNEIYSIDSKDIVLNLEGRDEQVGSVTQYFVDIDDIKRNCQGNNDDDGGTGDDNELTLPQSKSNIYTLYLNIDRGGGTDKDIIEMCARITGNGNRVKEQKFHIFDILRNDSQYKGQYLFLDDQKTPANSSTLGTYNFITRANTNSIVYLLTEEEHIINGESQKIYRIGNENQDYDTCPSLTGGCILVENNINPNNLSQTPCSGKFYRWTGIRWVETYNASTDACYIKNNNIPPSNISPPTSTIRCSNTTYNWNGNTWVKEDFGDNDDDGTQPRVNGTIDFITNPTADPDDNGGFQTGGPTPITGEGGDSLTDDDRIGRIEDESGGGNRS